MDTPTNEPNIENTQNSEQDETPTPVDAAIHVSISDDELDARMNIEPPRDGGAAPTFEVMQDALLEHGVTYNINKERLKEIEASPAYHRDIPIASGVAPVDGEDGSATFLIDTEGKSLKPQRNEDGSVDYHALNTVQTVSKDQPLCSIILPTDGTPGISVKGNELPQKKGKAVPSFVGKNTELTDEGTIIRSKIDGQVEFDGQKLVVTNVFYIKENVDYSTGNIKVTGNLVVSGMVMPDFAIEADGDIDVNGLVQAASVHSGGNVHLQSGLINSKLYCDGNLECKYIENSDVFVTGDVNAKNIINSKIICGKNIRATSKIIGGSIMAGQNIEAQAIGSGANVKTRLELGTDHTVFERQQELKNTITEGEEQNKKLGPIISLMKELREAGRLTPEKSEALEKAIVSFGTNLEAMEEAKAELDEIAQTIVEKLSGRIICPGTVYPGTQVYIGKANYIIAQKLSNVYLYYDEGEIGVHDAV